VTAASLIIKWYGHDDGAWWRKLMLQSRELEVFNYIIYINIDHLYIGFTEAL
jgi:hypothetical protein